MNFVRQVAVVCKGQRRTTRPRRGWQDHEMASHLWVVSDDIMHLLGVNIEGDNGLKEIGEYNKGETGD